METQAKPLINDRRWVALANSSTAMSPLIDELLTQPISPNVKVLKLPKYNTTQGNLYDHINSFKNKLPFYQDEKLYYKLFPTTFTGEAIDWYMRLVPKSIHSWLEFC